MTALCLNILDLHLFCAASVKVNLEIGQRGQCSQKMK
jgi:hypothetical protein